MTVLNAGIMTNYATKIAGMTQRSSKYSQSAQRAIVNF